MSNVVTTPDGARITYDQAGHGPVVILIGGAMQLRAVDPETRQLVEELAARDLCAIHYDRPGRGASTGSSPASLGGEIDAVRGLVDALGGTAALYGSSSGSAIALAAAVEVPGVSDLVLWEPPIAPAGSTQAAEALAAMQPTLATDDPERILRTFMEGMPPEWFVAIREGADWPQYAAMAPTVVADLDALAWAEREPRAERWPTVPGRATVLVGDGAFPFLRTAAEATAATLHHAALRTFSGQAHGWDPADLADEIANALSPDGNGITTG